QRLGCRGSGGAARARQLRRAHGRRRPPSRLPRRPRGTLRIVRVGRITGYEATNSHDSPSIERVTPSSGTSLVRRIGAREFDFSRRVAVMAIVNRTPDSFHDKGATFALDRAVEASLAAVADGADWVDVGGVPFGRGPVVELAEELERIVPVVEAIRAASDVVSSSDTLTARVAGAAPAAGADVGNGPSRRWARG